MKYEINVSLNGRHFFAIDSRSIGDEAKLDKVYATFKEKFSENEGFELYVSQTPEVSYGITKETWERYNKIKALEINKIYWINGFFRNSSHPELHGYAWVQAIYTGKKDYGYCFITCPEFMENREPETSHQSINPSGLQSIKTSEEYEAM